MHRIIIPAIIIFLLCVSPVMAAELEVIQTDVQLQQVVLHNPDTGEQRVYQRDEKIDGWQIEEIKSDSITMSHPPLSQGGPILMKTIPVKGARHIMEPMHPPGE